MQLKGFTLLGLATLAVAAPTAPASQCNTGPVLCCTSVQRADNTATSELLALLGIVVQDPSVLVGIACSPISVSGNSCSAQPVCCENDSFEGVVALGCNPVNVNV